MDVFSYDVAISFAGEQRREAEAIANCLREADVKVFFDEYAQAALWGKDLYEHLAKVYRHDARYCLMLVSAAYAAKVWTTHERRSAQARALEQKGDYILPVRFDDTEIPGLSPTVGYLAFQDHGVKGICGLMLEKLGSKAAPAAGPGRNELLTNSPRACLLDMERNTQAFINVAECEWGNAEATLTFQPDDQTDGPYLGSLRGIRSRLLIAFRNNLAECRIEEIRHSVKVAGEQWTVRARIENTDFAPGMEPSFGGLSADEIAEQRARRILLNEKATGVSKNINDAVRESFVRGINTVLKVDHSPFPTLYGQFGATPRKFLEIAWISAAMTLKASGVVVEVTTLELGIDGSELRVNFEGKRRKQYTNQPPTKVDPIVKTIFCPQ